MKRDFFLLSPVIAAYLAMFAAFFNLAGATSDLRPFLWIAFVIAWPIAWVCGAAAFALLGLRRNVGFAWLRRALTLLFFLPIFIVGNGIAEDCTMILRNRGTPGSEGVEATMYAELSGNGMARGLYGSWRDLPAAFAFGAVVCGAWCLIAGAFSLGRKKFVSPAKQAPS